jgi:hypothetical protein
MHASKAKNVKKGTDLEDSRRRRENRSLALRKEKREEGVDKRRRAPVEEAAPAAAAGSTLPAELSLEHLGAYCEGAWEASMRAAPRWRAAPLARASARVPITARALSRRTSFRALPLSRLSYPFPPPPSHSRAL